MKHPRGGRLGTWAVKESTRTPQRRRGDLFIWIGGAAESMGAVCTVVEWGVTCGPFVLGPHLDRSGHSDTL